MMSFINLHRRTAPPTAHNQRKKLKKKPAWDDTNQDLTVHKASPKEIARRKLTSVSTNIDLVQEEKLHKRISKAKKMRAPSKPNQLPLLREVLLDKNQLEDVIAKSDRAMAVVRDLFGDDPKRYRGMPNVTVAPGHDYFDGSLPCRPDGPSKLDIVSDSVMDKSALNTLDGHETEDEDENVENLQYKTLLDFGRFRKFLETEHSRPKDEKDIMTLEDAKHMASVMNAEMSRLGIQSVADVQKTPPRSSQCPGEADTQTPLTNPPLKAMNDTGKVNRVRSRIGQYDEDEKHNSKTELDNKNNSASTSRGHLQLDDLREVLNGLEGNLAAYERQTGRTNSVRSAPPETFSGYTMSLVTAVNKLTVYLKESELRLRAETTLREQLTEDVDQLKEIIERLTTDVITMQEEYVNQQDEFYKYRLISQQELHNIKAALVGMGIPVLQAHEQLGGPNTTTVQPPRVGKYPNTFSLEPQSSHVPSTQLNQEQKPFVHNQHPPVHQAPQQKSHHAVESQHLRNIPQNAQSQLPRHQQQTQVTRSLKDMSSLTTHELQMMMLQQMKLNKAIQPDPVRDSDVPTQDSDSHSLQQHELSQSLSESTLKGSLFSAGRPVPDFTHGQPSTAVPARLLTPPRQSNSPQNLGKKLPSHLGNGDNSLAAKVDLFRHQGKIDRLRNVLQNQPRGPQNDNANDDHVYFQPLEPDLSQSDYAELQQQRYSNPQVGERHEQYEVLTDRSAISNHSIGPAERLIMNRQLFERQVEELNRQRTEAEGKLQRLRQHNYDVVNKVITEVAAPGHFHSVSPIPVGSESEAASTVVSDVSSNFIRENKNQNAGSSRSRGITVPLPQMEMLNSSNTSTPPSKVRVSENNSPVPIMTLSPRRDDNTPFKDTHKVHPKAAFFALSTHVY